MSQTSDPSSSFATALSPAAAGGAAAIRDGLRGKFVCPFCGSVNDSEQGMCPRCTMENSAATRKATKTRIGPWYVLQTRNPAAPGMTWETLVSFVRKGRVKPRSIVRGPTTHQLWRFAAQVKGLSREFGICYSCGSSVEPSAALCPTCNRLQDPPPNPDALLEASRDGQQPVGGPATIVGGAAPGGGGNDGGGLMAGPATIVSQVPPNFAADPAAGAGDFVIPALGGMTPAGAGPATPQAGAMSTGGLPLGATSSGAMSAGPPTVVAGIPGDASWARINPGNVSGSGGGRGPQPQPPQPRPGARQPAGNGAPPPGGPRFNPYADDDAAPPTGNRTDGSQGFLSAKDLAAAFNLGFVGEDDETPVQRTVRNPAAARNAQGYGGAPPRRRRFRALKVVFVLLLLAAAATAAAYYFHEGFRKSADQWYEDAVTRLNAPNEGDRYGDQQPRRAAPPAPPGTAGSRRATPGTNPTTDPAAPATNDAAGGGTPASPATGPAGGGAAAPQPAGGSDSPAVWVEVQRIYADALEQQETDEAGALAKLKAIHDKYPRTVWPGDLESRVRNLQASVDRKPRAGAQPK